MPKLNYNERVASPLADLGGIGLLATPSLEEQNNKKQ